MKKFTYKTLPESVKDYIIEIYGGGEATVNYIWGSKVGCIADFWERCFTINQKRMVLSAVRVKRLKEIAPINREIDLLTKVIERI
jgi:hypothetical protein